MPPIIPGILCTAVFLVVANTSADKALLGTFLVGFFGNVLFWSLVFWPVINVVCRMRERKASAAKLKSDVKQVPED